MKPVFYSLVFLLTSLAAIGQGNPATAAIDQEVQAIEKLKLNVLTDSASEKQAVMDALSRVRFVFLYDEKDSVRKIMVTNEVSYTDNGRREQIVSSSVYYFRHGSLIKATEAATKGDRSVHTEYFYERGVILQSNEQGGANTVSRGPLLLQFAGVYLDQFKISRLTSKAK